MVADGGSSLRDAEKLLGFWEVVMVEDHHPQRRSHKKDFTSVGYSEIFLMEVEAELYRELLWCR